MPTKPWVITERLTNIFTDIFMDIVDDKLRLSHHLWPLTSLPSYWINSSLITPSPHNNSKCTATAPRRGLSNRLAWMMPSYLLTR